MAKKHAAFIAKLRQVRKLIKKGWTQNAQARDEYDRSVHPNSIKALR